jgi:isopentenyl diphosphate isomerase/L-lactate dehydrogenase-like FMN-dependent dehydrogenase
MIASARKVSSSQVVNIEDLRRLAKRRLPRVVFDYLDGGAEAEITLRENCRAFEEITFCPRQAVSKTDSDLRTRVLGSEISFPVILAPIGYTRLIHASGELAVARVAAAAGIGYVVATFAGHRLEDVRESSSGPLWYQLYLIGGREAAEAGIERARQAGYSALVITVDTSVSGLRERDVRNGMKELLAGSPFAKLPFLGQFLIRPAWLTSFLLDGGLPKLENVVIQGQGPMPLVDVSAGLASAAIVVSNHGGRQLDGVSATIKALPEVVSAVNGQAEVLMDSGVRRGSDIVKAICLGARAVLIGRAYGYGLGAAGEAGVTRALEILRADLERTLRLLGCGTLEDLDSSLVKLPAEWRY